MCCPPQPEKTIVPAIDVLLSPKEEMPSLSNSPGSESDNFSLRSNMEDSALGKSRGNEKHLTPQTLGKIIVKIHESEQTSDVVEPLDPELEAVVISKCSPEKSSILQQSPVSERSQPVNYTTESSVLSSMTANTEATERNSVHHSSDTSVSSDGIIRSGSVVHGFSPPPSLRSRGSSTIAKNVPIIVPGSAMKAQTMAAKKKGMFTLGGSSEDESSFDGQMSYRKTLLAEPKKSNLSQSLTKDDVAPQKKKTTSFREVIEQHNIQNGGSSVDDNAIASDDEDDDSIIDDSAIEEDDEDGWEDEQPEEEKPTLKPIFKRVDSSANLPSRRSILTQGLTEGDRQKGLLAAASKSSPALKRIHRAASHNGPSVVGSPEEEGMMMRTSNINIPTPSNETVYAQAHSPRTTRRNMLSTELTESLRKNLLWERQQKNTTVNAFLKREAKSMANLQRAGQLAGAQPQPHRTLLTTSRDNTSHNDYFNVSNEYHTKGW